MILNLTLDRIEGDKAVLKEEDGTVIHWPKDKLPANAKEGAVFSFTISGDRNQELDNRKLAKDILNEILNPEDQVT